jgi:hypothetical protein
MMRLSVRSRARGLEVLLCTGLLAVVIGACLQCVPALAVKARLVSVFIASTSARSDSAEAFASSGDWPVPSRPVAVGMEGTTDIAVAFEPAAAGMVARGTVGRAAQPFAISLVPAASDGGQHVRWLCGLRRAPAGWQAASGPRVLDLPFHASYGECRDVKEGA